MMQKCIKQQHQNFMCFESELQQIYDFSKSGVDLTFSEFAELFCIRCPYQFMFDLSYGDVKTLSTC